MDKEIIRLFLIIVLLTGCESLSQEEPQPVYDFKGMYVESNINRSSMGAVRLLIDEDSMYRGWTYGEFIKHNRGVWIMADTISVEFRSYGANQVGVAGQGVFYNFRIESRMVWNKDTIIFTSTEWKADEWEGLKYTSIFTKL